MNRKQIALGSAIAVLVLSSLAIGCGAKVPRTEQDQGSAIGSATCVRGPTRTPPTFNPGFRTPLPPDLRPDAERMAEIEAGRQRHFDETSKLIASGCDPRNFPMRAISHLDGSPPGTLDEAIARADVVVIAHVTKTAFTLIAGDDQPLAHQTLVVELILKGDATREVILYTIGGPIPDDGGMIGILKGDPVLLGGDRVLLLATKKTGEPYAGEYWPVYPVGKYYIRNGALYAPDGNPCNWIDGLSEGDAIQLIEASLRHKPQGAQDATHGCDWSRF